MAKPRCELLHLGLGLDCICGRYDLSRSQQHAGLATHLQPGRLAVKPRFPSNVTDSTRCKDASDCTRYVRIVVGQDTSSGATHTTAEGCVAHLSGFQGALKADALVKDERRARVETRRQGRRINSWSLALLSPRCNLPRQDDGSEVRWQGLQGLQVDIEVESITLASSEQLQETTVVHAL